MLKIRYFIVVLFLYAFSSGAVAQSEHEQEHKHGNKTKTDLNEHIEDQEINAKNKVDPHADCTHEEGEHEANKVDPHADCDHDEGEHEEGEHEESKAHSDIHDADHIEDGIITGIVVERDGKTLNPLPGANVYWTGTTKGVISDADGLFEIPIVQGAHYLIVSYVGFGKDSVHLHEPTNIEIEFNKATALKEVEVVYRRLATSYNLNSAFNVQDMHEKELLKCACCNLSESFETNPAVDVSVTDAVTGTRQIEMLGLSGQYVQITRENMPHIRGLSAIYGLTYVPGSWIESIQLNTGTGSVVNGFESITGQINVEMKKPGVGDKIYVNLFGSNDGMMEANLILSQKMSDKWATSLLLHGKYQPFELDHNSDGFMDHPAVTNGIFMHRWNYQDEEGLNMVFGLKGTNTNTNSGEISYDHEQDYTSQSAWGSGINTMRWEAWTKIGKVFPDRPNSSLGFQLSGMIHKQDAFFGRRIYDAKQQSLYSNLIYMGILGNTNHQYRTGASFQMDKYDETLINVNYLRNEIVPGAFVEYTYNYLDKFSVVSGLRADYHNTFGLFFTPRLHMRFAPIETSVIRAMAGRGQKTANVIAENIGMFASSRAIIIEASDNSASYGFDPEVAWNSGISFAQEFTLAERKGVAKIDYYYTWFTNQIIANYDRDVDAVYIQSIDGKSYSSSLQAQINYELLKNYDIRMAYRFNDVRSTIDGDLLPEALTPKHRAFLNMAYESESNWALDMTVTWQGMKRIPGTSANPEEFQMDSYSSDFYLWNGQISKKLFDNKFDIYLGAENILNYRQKNPIIDAANPFGEYFDASLIWGPVFGRKIYAGIRIRI